MKFHDGSALTSRDIKASLDHVIFPPAGVTSPRKAVYRQVASVDAPNPTTVRITLKQASPAMLTFLASPWNYIYKAEMLEKDPHWYKKNVMGTGPFKLGEYVPGSHVLGKKNPDYFLKGLPYLDGFRALFIIDGAARGSLRCAAGAWRSTSSGRRRRWTRRACDRRSATSWSSRRATGHACSRSRSITRRSRSTTRACGKP